MTLEYIAKCDNLELEVEIACVEGRYEDALSLEAELRLVRNAR